MRQSRRKPKKRALKTTVYIICEGKNTEPNYFKRIKEQIEAQTSKYWVLVELVDTDQTDALGLVELARHYKGEYTEVWVVFDKNGYTKHPQAFALAQEEGIQIAFSSISFETWVLLHFEKSQEAFRKSAELVHYLKASGHFPGYDKKAHTDTYPHLAPWLDRAYENAAWLRYLSSKANPDSPIYQLNPYTDVDCLVKKLLNHDQEYIWGVLREELEGQDLGITLHLEEDKARRVHFTLLLKNQGAKACVINPQKQSPLFFVSTSSLCSCLLEELPGAFTLLPKQQETITLKCSAMPRSETCFFVMKWGHTQVMIRL